MKHKKSSYKDERIFVHSVGKSGLSNRDLAEEPEIIEITANLFHNYRSD